MHISVNKMHTQIYKFHLKKMDKCYLTPVEVGSSGHITHKNKNEILNSLRHFKTRLRKNIFCKSSQYLSIVHNEYIPCFLSEGMGRSHPPLLSP